MKAQDRGALFQTLKLRFEKNLHRHKGLVWNKIHAKLEVSTEALTALAKMETTGGEPDVIGYDKAADQYLFCDCSAESPVGRRSLCFDGKALLSRKENKPKGSALEAASEIGIDLLTQAQYCDLQRLGEFDTKTSSWIATPMTCVRWAARWFVIAATARSSFITMERSRTTQPEVFVACCVSSSCKADQLGARFFCSLPPRNLSAQCKDAQAKGGV